MTLLHIYETLSIPSSSSEFSVSATSATQLRLQIVAYSWAGVNLGIVLGFFMGVTFFILIYKYYIENTESMSATSRLKNALLSYALLKVKKDDFEEGLDSGVSFVNFTTPIINYKTYDGDKLPRLRGFTIYNALMSYIVKPYKSFFYYTDHMNDKYIAIEKYIQKHLATDQQVIDFFKTFIDEVESTKETQLRRENMKSTEETKEFDSKCVSNKDVGTSTSPCLPTDDTKSDADDSTASIVDEYKSDMDESIISLE